MISLINHGKICFVSNRVNLLEFDDKDELKKKYKRNKQYFPIFCEYSSLNNELIIATRSDVRFIDIKNGRTKKIFTGLVNKGEDITVFRIVQ